MRGLCKLYYSKGVPPTQKITAQPNQWLPNEFFGFLQIFSVSLDRNLSILLVVVD